MRDQLSNTQVVHLGNLTISGTGTVTSGYVDMRDFQACDIAVICNTVTDAGTAAGFTATLQESADTAGASATTVAAAQAVDGVTTVAVTSDSADNTCAGRVGYHGTSRYAGITITGTTGSDADVSIIATLGKPKIAPCDPVGTVVART